MTTKGFSPEAAGKWVEAYRVMHRIAEEKKDRNQIIKEWLQSSIDNLMFKEEELIAKLTVEIKGLDAVKKAIAKLDLNKIIQEALEKQLIKPPMIMSTRPACPHCSRYTLTGYLDREYGEEPNGNYLSTTCSAVDCGKIVFMTEGWKTINTEPEIKPCPFCGAEGLMDSWGKVRCSNKKCSLASVYILAEDWDKRA